MATRKPVKKITAAPRTTPSAAFPIICLGASAGGLEAFEKFFQNISPNSGAAFVLVQHLDPNHVSALTEILRRSTFMPVTEIEDQMKVAPNQVYVIPPNRDMQIRNSTLQLRTPDMPHGQRMPIDAFMRSLAEDQGENAIGIILSGTGSDGTLGLRAILGAGGISLVQDPATAKFGGMPTSAIKEGYACYVLPVEEMGAMLRHGKPASASASSSVALDPGSVKRILALLHTLTGHDFSLYKTSTISRRIERRMTQHVIDDPEVYLRYLKEHAAEAQILFKGLLINVTSFFRDPEAFEILKQDVLPQLIANKPRNYVFRIWVAGVATGEEAYSIAIVLRELMEESKLNFEVQIYASDLDEDAIAFARRGVYLPNIVADVSPERLQRWFVESEFGYRITKDIREMVIFALHNVVKDPPFTKLDFLSCRNLMIYLEPELQNHLISVFHYALKPDGMLFLSSSESIGNHTELFAAQNRKWRFYRANHSVTTSRALLPSKRREVSSDTPIAEPSLPRVAGVTIGDIARRALLTSFAPASAVTDLHGNIRYIHGDTGKYLRPAPGQATLNIIDMAREGLQQPLRIAIQTGGQQQESHLSRGIAIKTDGGQHLVRVNVRALPEKDGSDNLLLVSFQDISFTPVIETLGKLSWGRKPKSSEEQLQIENLEHHLAQTKEDLQLTIEKQQTITEEFKSSNEELQSMNEEMQSSNEELETSKEELQSVNEELITVNTELQSKIEQLGLIQSDMKNLLDNIHIGTLFLDQNMVIRRFTRDATQLYRLVETDVGRPLADIKSDMIGPDILPDAEAVLNSLVACEREVITTSGLWYLARIQPYRTINNVIDGVVVTFTNITTQVENKRAVLLAKAKAEGIIDTVQEPLLVLDEKLQVVSASRSFYRVFQVTPDGTLGHMIYDLGNRQWNIPALREVLETLLPRDQVLEDYAVEGNFPAIGYRKFLLNARRVFNATGAAPMILLAIHSLAEEKS